MGSLQSEIDSLQEQLQVKKAEEQLLKFLQEGISNFRDKIKQRIELLRAEMISNHSEHQQQIQTMSSELTQLREMGSDLRNAFQYQFSKLVTLNNKIPPAPPAATNLSSSC
jgi:chromosome segregation ATPase